MLLDFEYISRDKFSARRDQPSHSEYLMSTALGNALLDLGVGGNALATGGGRLSLSDVRVITASVKLH